MEGTNMEQVGLIGNFCGDGIGGQATKTRELYREMCREFGIVRKLDVYEMKNNYLKLFTGVFSVLKHSEKVVIILGTPGYFKILPYVLSLNRLFHRNLYEVVIGGLRPQYVKEKKCRIRWEKNIKKIYGESRFMVKQYKELGLENAEYQPNFKRMEILSEQEMEKGFRQDGVLRLCTFSRVVKMKGIDTAIDIVESFNRKYGNGKILLDVMGPVDAEYKEEFECLMRGKDKSIIRYCGEIDSNETLRALKKYDLILFPTRFKREGLPGTFLDAMAAGLPILATDLKNFHDAVRNGYNGYLIREEDGIEKYIYYLKELLENKNNLLQMKKCALLEAEQYLPEYALEPMWKEIGKAEKFHK